MSEVIVANIIVLSSIAVAAAIILYFAAQKFKTESNPVADEIAAMLPQANCGACGKAGCQDFANACAAADAESFARLYCPVGGAKVMNTVAARLGYSSAEHEPTVAVLALAKTLPTKSNTSASRAAGLPIAPLSAKPAVPTAVCVWVTAFATAPSAPLK